MKLRTYSSMEAFLAHYRILREQPHADGEIHPLDDAERETLAEMDRLAAPLAASERDALFDSTPDGARARRHQRAELKLCRILVGHGILRG
jgi:hypothetical protein